MSDFSTSVLPLPMRHPCARLELLKTMKMPSDDQVNAVILQMHFCMEWMERDFYFHAETRWWKHIHGKLA